MTDTVNLIQSTALRMTERLDTLAHLLGTAKTQLASNREPLSTLMTARIADDMLPFPYQIVFACNQANDLAAWASAGERTPVEPASMSFDDLTQHVRETRERLTSVQLQLGNDLLGAERRVDLPAGQFLRLTGAEFADGFLMPNFYFHIVTAYTLMRMIGLDVGKVDYMTHLVPFVESQT